MNEERYHKIVGGERMRLGGNFVAPLFIYLPTPNFSLKYAIVLLVVWAAKAAPNVASNTSPIVMNK